MEGPGFSGCGETCMAQPSPPAMTRARPAASGLARSGWSRIPRRGDTAVTTNLEPAALCVRPVSTLCVTTGCTFAPSELPPHHRISLSTPYSCGNRISTSFRQPHECALPEITGGSPSPALGPRTAWLPVCTEVRFFSLSSPASEPPQTLH